MNTTTSLIDDVMAHNDVFVRERFQPALKIMPKRKTLILGCVDPRVDPDVIFGFSPADSAVIRNVGGRVTPSTFETLEMLEEVVRASGGVAGVGFNLVVLHHTDCGIKKLAHSHDLLGSYFGVPAAELEGLAITDPYRSVALDVAALKANPKLAGGFIVSGLVYDVATGKLTTVVKPALLRGE